MKTKIAIFASGGGTNAQAILDYFKTSKNAEIALVVSNKSNAYVLERAEKNEIPSYVHSKQDKTDGTLEAVLEAFEIDFIVLAGYLQKIETTLISKFQNRIINIHPALLPNYGGKGMYGMHVHQAVFENKENESGITIHYVNENYDEGNIIAQHKCDISMCSTAEEIQKKVLNLEHKHFAPTINTLITNLRDKK